MALVATDPARLWRAVVVSRPTSKDASRPMVVDLVAAGSEEDRLRRAKEALSLAVSWYHDGLCEPLPYFPRYSHALAHDLSRAHLWHGFTYPGDGDRPAVRWAYGDLDDVELLELPARPGDPPGRGGRVERLAVELWDVVERSTTHDPSRAASGSTTRNGFGS